MAQNEMQEPGAPPRKGRAWRFDLDQPSPWQIAAMVLLAFTIGATLGLFLS